MITAIRDVRRAKNMTLEEVGRACVPPTTAQTIGRLETGTRTVSIGWLNRIADALGVAATGRSARSGSLTSSCRIAPTCPSRPCSMRAVRTRRAARPR
jgi:transcriptional regulator with XRE-family HTH domain